MAEGASLGCIGDEGNPVDVWVSFKYPEGTKYAYGEHTYKYIHVVDDDDDYYIDEEFTVSVREAAEGRRYRKGQATGLNYTLSQLYGTNGRVTYSMFNDQPPGGKEEHEGVEMWKMGHTKGILASNETGHGFWMVHSMPRFPERPEEGKEFSYMKYEETEFAHNFMCVSIKGWEQFDRIGESILQFNRPYYYAKEGFTEEVKEKAPEWYASVIEGKHVVGPKSSVLSDIEERGVIKAFAKTGFYGKGWDIYSNLLAPTFDSNLIYVQTWRTEKGEPLRSTCTGPLGDPGQKGSVYNAKEISFGQWGSGYAPFTKWNYEEDHSKWAIATGSAWIDYQSKPFSWFCGCDIDRMAWQGNRGGGCLCVKMPMDQPHVGIEKCYENEEE